MVLHTNLHRDFFFSLWYYIQKVSATKIVTLQIKTNDKSNHQTFQEESEKQLC